MFIVIIIIIIVNSIKFFNFDWKGTFLEENHPLYLLQLYGAL